jgi:hypothetical protein
MYRKLVVAALVSLIPSAAMAQVDCAASAPPLTERLLPIASANVGYYSSHNLSSFPNVKVRRAVIMVHGLSGNAQRYYTTLFRSACRARSDGLAPNVEQETVLISPHFRSTDDEGDHPAGYHYWSGDHWSRGSESTTGAGVSSYAVLDALIGKLTGTVRMSPFLPFERRYPNLEMIVVAGHSAGGQFAHRYAGTNGRHGTVAGVQMRYVVSAPSSFLYLDDHRPYTDRNTGAGDPYRAVSNSLIPYLPNPGFESAPYCPTSYNDWKFGLEDLNNYASAVGATTIRQRLLARPVTVIVGTEDNLPDAADLDRSCPAALQGTSRYLRAVRYVMYLEARFPQHHHAFVDVMGADHIPENVFIGPAGFSVGAATLFLD